MFFKWQLKIENCFQLTCEVTDSCLCAIAPDAKVFACCWIQTIHHSKKFPIWAAVPRKHSMQCVRSNYKVIPGHYHSISYQYLLMKLEVNLKHLRYSNKFVNVLFTTSLSNVFHLHQFHYVEGQQLVWILDQDKFLLLCSPLSLKQQQQQQQPLHEFALLHYFLAYYSKLFIPSTNIGKLSGLNAWTVHFANIYCVFWEPGAASLSKWCILSFN